MVKIAAKFETGKYNCEKKKHNQYCIKFISVRVFFLYFYFKFYNRIIFLLKNVQQLFLQSFNLIHDNNSKLKLIGIEIRILLALDSIHL